MTDTYWVRLRPTSHYFFGGENGLGSGDSRNYLVHSRIWPQQTSLLGLVRYLLLREKGWLSERGKPVPAEAAGLIGESSFDLGEIPEDLDTQIKFGAIKTLSPVLLQKKQKDGSWQSYTPGPENEGFPLEKVEAEVWYGGLDEAFQDAHRLKGYKAKKGLTPQLIDISNGKGLPEKESPFIFESQIGIEKGRDGRTKDQAFYKQTFVRLAKDWSFGFYLEVDAGTDLPEQTVLPFGGERRLFNWQASKVKVRPDWEQSTQMPGQDAERIVLLSNSLIEAAVLEDCSFAVITEMPFRFLQSTTLLTSEYANLGSDPGKVQKSSRFNLLAAGSVLYPRDVDKVKTSLNKARLRQIGYNHFVYLNS